MPMNQRWLALGASVCLHGLALALLIPSNFSDRPPPHSQPVWAILLQDAAHNRVEVSIPVKVEPSLPDSTHQPELPQGLAREPNHSGSPVAAPIAAFVPAMPLPPLHAVSANEEKLDCKSPAGAPNAALDGCSQVGNP